MKKFSLLFSFLLDSQIVFNFWPKLGKDKREREKIFSAINFDYIQQIESLLWLFLSIEEEKDENGERKNSDEKLRQNSNNKCWEKRRKNEQINKWIVYTIIWPNLT